MTAAFGGRDEGRSRVLSCQHDDDRLLGPLNGDQQDGGKRERRHESD